jgi:hypothetical protein
MSWFRKSPDEPAGVRDRLAPVGIAAEFDRELFAMHLSQLRKSAEVDGGIEGFLEALGAKHRRFADALGTGTSRSLTLAQIGGLLDTVFTARRRIFPALDAIGEDGAGAAVHELIAGKGALAERMRAFADALPVTAGEGREAARTAAKVRRAAWDFAAELLHYGDPLRFPLMTRWVWDEATMSGALREFVRGHEHVARLPLDNRPETYAGARGWFADRIAEQGIYRDIHFWVDMVQAQAYTTYLRSMAEGNLGGDFGRGTRPGEQLKKLLGIETARGNGRSRVSKPGAELRSQH